MQGVTGEVEVPRVSRPLGVFRHRNYRLFFGGQLISLTGTWMQQIAQSWLVTDIVSRGKAELTMGVISSVSALPILLLSFYAGIVADRFNKRNLMVVTQGSAMVLAFVLSSLTHWHIVTIYHIAAIGFLLGTVNAFDAPARQSFVVEMVGREDLPNAIALNSAMFNGARIMGPAVAGVVIAAVGVAGAFFVNGVSFIAVIIGLLLMHVNRVPPKMGGSAWLEFKEGFRFIRNESTVKALLTLTGILSIFATPYMVLLPIFVRYNLHGNVKSLGLMFTATGVGALAGALTLFILGNFSWKGKLLLLGNIVFCCMLVMFSYSRSLTFAIPVLMLAGWGMMTNMALTNTIIQTIVPDKLRGRVISVYTFMFMGMTPIGSLVAGVVAHSVGVAWAIRLGAVVCGAAALTLSSKFFYAGGQSE